MSEIPTNVMPSAPMPVMSLPPVPVMSLAPVPGTALDVYRLEKLKSLADIMSDHRARRDRR